MSGCSFRRFLASALVAASGVAMVATSFDADARRLGGGGSFGRQSSNVFKQRQAITPPAGTTKPAGSTAAPAAGAATAGATGAAARSGVSRWLGPIAGIAAGLGLAALLSHLGLSAAFAELLSSLLLIALVAFAVLFILRRLRGGAARPAMQGAYGMARQSDTPAQQPSAWRGGAATGGAAAMTPALPAESAAAAATEGDGNWFIPGDFDSQNFLQQAKEQFVRIQGIWDTGDTGRLHEYLTDDLIDELKPQLAQRQGAANRTEVVLLNAELLGIEAVSDGHLASVRFSGMLREEAGAEAFRFEEVWNLFKPSNGGWLLAGIQQIPVQQAS